MKPRIIISLLTATLAALLALPGSGQAAPEMKLKGRVDVLPAGPGGALTLPLAQGAPPVSLLVGLGTPAFQLAVEVTPSTFVEGAPLHLVDGDAVQVEAQLVSGVLRATEIHREDFGEVRLRGTAQGLPGSGLLPLPPGLVVDFVLALGVPGGDIPVRLTSQARLEGGPFTLANGTAIEVEGFVDDFRVLIAEIGPAVSGAGGGGGTGGGGGAGAAVGIRVRCRVPDGRVRVQIDGQGLAPGTYTAALTNTTTGAGPVDSKPQTATPTVFDLDFDFDSTAGPGDLDTPIAAGFAAPEHVVEATINPGGLATGQATCTSD